MYKIRTLIKIVTIIIHKSLFIILLQNCDKYLIEYKFAYLQDIGAYYGM